LLQSSKDLLYFFYKEFYGEKIKFSNTKNALLKINRKFRVPRKQGAHFLGARAQIQDSWAFSSSA
jgi:hypothetical protein